MRVAVTGGSGFIGSHVLDRLHAHGHEPRNVDLRPSPYATYDTVIADLLDRDGLRRAFDGCDAVIHLAAVADVNHVAADPAQAELVNTHGTATVLDVARELGTPRVVYGSTIWVYGDGNPGEVLDEDAALPTPKHLYTATKLAGEHYCATFGVEHTILRFGIPYGPRARPATVLAAFVARALEGSAITIAGDGKQSRRFVYVEDLADGCVAALADGAANRTYNLVGDESVTVREIADLVRELVADVPVVHVEGRAGDIQGAAISGERAARELGWRPTTSFRDGAARYVAWLTEQSSAPQAVTA
ncbi:MAG: NAD-dependent epimerase/dehydratase family protein [Actinobacteria bacterium]|nr:NAD-dependent epimerase/dehydratase family protein [Actinomycetota bacterium]MBV8397110.1 NAD-dependent epimerase/dehydratase family protein [Actinomycetota bacterium]